ncbi:hypothetical protein ASPFODRAFT_57968 [Aspergillus luchuensis CBS 106.47]|uniref:Protein kinase domain-containing protein n=1 Tax=Aspergillus luchuensis (strain CBS 106.47) TaxID=1137211 RepID=A0A1M3TQW8_ASPLC|nr:hypothetical protein ASPFODRAFT_57968 [Aspergillus luchuensis CBS 106.47]
MELDLSDIEFVEQIKSSTSSCIFRTRWRNRDCILKVYHSITASHADPIDREVNIYGYESQAYTRLKAHGLCQMGSIPDFYSMITRINPKKWLPYLNEFFDDNLHPNAILNEYIPNLQQIGLSTFSKKRVNKLHQILAEIHQARVYHADPYPQNMMRQWPEEEDELRDYFVGALATDYEEGKIHRTWEFYYKFKSLSD